jgi:hypothetical protein
VRGERGVESSECAAVEEESEGVRVRVRRWPECAVSVCIWSADRLPRRLPTSEPLEPEVRWERWLE